LRGAACRLYRFLGLAPGADGPAIKAFLRSLWPAVSPDVHARCRTRRRSRKLPRLRDAKSIRLLALIRSGATANARERAKKKRFWMGGTCPAWSVSCVAEHAAHPPAAARPIVATWPSERPKQRCRKQCGTSVPHEHGRQNMDCEEVIEADWRSGFDCPPQRSLPLVSCARRIASGSWCAG